MNEMAVIEVGREAFVVIMKISAPILIAGMIIGLIISIIQTLTSIQEMTLTFVPKIIVIFVTTILFLPFMVNVLNEFALSLFDRIVALG